MQTVCLHPHPLLLRVPRLCAPPWRPPSSPRTLSGGALFPPPFTRGVCATPPLCANGECRAARKGTPPSLGPAQPNRTANATIAATAASAPPCPCERVGEKAAPPFGRGPGEARKRRRMGGGAASRAPLPPFAYGGATQTLRAGCPPFTLLPYPMRLNGAAHNPRAAREAGALKGSGAPPPLRVSTTPRARRVRLCSHPLPCRGGECLHTHLPLARAAPLPTSPSCGRRSLACAPARPHPLCRTPTSLPAVGGKAVRRATLGRVEEAARPRTTRGSGQRATPCEGDRSRAQPGKRAASNPGGGG